MPRLARVVVPGCPCHVTQRGNNRQDVFFVDDDRRMYLSLLAGQARRHGLALHAYCLMTNHVHLIATPRTSRSLALALGRAHYLYTLYVNRLHGRVGHLWQNRFFSCALDEPHLRAAMVYVERNPVRAKLARRAWAYQWSSAAAHCRPEAAPEWLEMELWRDLDGQGQWQSVLSEPLDEQAILAIRRSTRTGRPLGSDSFISKIETLLGRRLRPLPVGRQKGWRKANAKHKRGQNKR